MIQKDKELKCLYHLYNKKLKKLHKQNFKNFSNSLIYFVTYLQYIRDYLILTEPLEINGEENFKIASLATAIDEYFKYISC